MQIFGHLFIILLRIGLRSLGDIWDSSRGHEWNYPIDN